MVHPPVCNHPRPPFFRLLPCHTKNFKSLLFCLKKCIYMDGMFCQNGHRTSNYGLSSCAICKQFNWFQSLLIATCVLVFRMEEIFYTPYVKNYLHTSQEINVSGKTTYAFTFLYSHATENESLRHKFESLLALKIWDQFQ